MAAGLVNAATRRVDEIDLGLAVVQQAQQENPDRQVEYASQ